MRSTALVIFLVLLATTGMVATHAAPAPAQLAATHGYVYVNLPGRYVLNATIALRPLGQKKEFPLEKRHDSGVDSYGAWLPAGEYQLAKWDSYSWDDYVPISVKAGQITDLGSLIPFSLGAYQIVVLPLRPREYASSVQDPVQEFRRILAAAPPIQWSPTVPPKPFTVQLPPSGLGLIADLLLEHSRTVNKPSLRTQLASANSIEEFLALAKTLAPPLADTAVFDEHGNAYFGAEIGQIRVRSSNGNWSALDTGSIEAITAVNLSGDRILAGTRTGTVLASSDGGTSWVTAATLPGNEEVIDVHRIAKRWLIVTERAALVRFDTPSFDDVKVYSSDRDDMTDLQVIRETHLNMHALPALDWRATVHVVDGEYFINLLPDLLRLDPASLEWRKISPPATVTGFTVSPKGSVIAAYRKAGMFSNLYVSIDRGATWKKFPAPPYAIEDVYFDDDSHGTAVRTRMDAFSGAQELLVYDGTAARWTKVTDAPKGCIKVLHDDQHQPRFCEGLGGSLFGDTNGGWVVEFAVD